MEAIGNVSQLLVQLVRNLVQLRRELMLDCIRSIRWGFPLHLQLVGQIVAGLVQSFGQGCTYLLSLLGQVAPNLLSFIDQVGSHLLPFLDERLSHFFFLSGCGKTHLFFFPVKLMF